MKPGTSDCADIDLSYPLLYYGVDHDWSCPLLDQSDIDTKTTEMIDALSTDIGELQYGFFFDKDVETNGFPSKVSEAASEAASEVSSVCVMCVCVMCV